VDFAGKAEFMSGETEQIKRKLEEMLASSDMEWVRAVSVTVNAMHEQFKKERQERKVIPLFPGKALTRQNRQIARNPGKRAVK
jgi:hypothetical protein